MATTADIATAITGQLAADSLPPLNSDLATNALLTRLVDLSVLQLAAVQDVVSFSVISRYTSFR